MNKYFLTIIITVAGLFLGHAQQDAQYTQYMYNTISVNPAYAGSRGVFSIAALHRSQWVGLDGAPTTQTLNFHTPVSDHVGLGLSVVNDEIGNGTNQDTYIDAAFSYTVNTSETGKLSFGLKAGGHLF
ncbi:PorP/SprF family type IX secretion system membrane protein, partial [Maribacter sp. SA7]|uniref:PorP/SprF family type IX secretion system membrane protein n=1 Tax=Maribacter zhoushanensis TaxID=3030012 RepID=UPI0023EAE8DE